MDFMLSNRNPFSELREDCKNVFYAKTKLPRVETALLIGFGSVDGRFRLIEEVGDLLRGRLGAEADDNSRDQAAAFDIRRTAEDYLKVFESVR